MFSKLFTVKLTKPLTIELQRIILWKLFYCVARRKLIRRAKTVLQTKMVISLWFYSLLACPEIFYCDSQGHYTIKIPEIYFFRCLWFCEFDGKNHLAVFWILPTTVFKSLWVSQAIPGATYVCHHRWHVHEKHICTHKWQIYKYFGLLNGVMTIQLTGCHYLLFVNSDVCRNSTDKTNQLLVTCDTHTTVPFWFPARRFKSPERSFVT